MLVLGLHIIEGVQDDMYYIVSYTNDHNVTITTYFQESAEWFGKSVSLNFIYDLVLYSILGLIGVVIILILSEKKVKVGDKRKIEIFDLWCKCQLIINDIKLNNKEKNVELEKLFKEYKYK